MRFRDIPFTSRPFPQSLPRDRGPRKTCRPSHWTASACLLTMLLFQGAWSKSAASAKPAPKPKANSAAASPASSPLQLDSARVHRMYLEGEFDAAIAILEDNLKETRQYRHEDSVFIFKHLGVMYAAQTETRERGKYYMHKLLAVEPTARIMDMYASDMIYMIFKNIQEEFASTRMLLAERQGNAARTDSRPVRKREQPSEAKPRPAGASKEKPSEGKKWMWAGIAVAAVAAGGGAYYLINAEPQVRVTEVEVPF
jgi:hypothetical protein